jgi:uncharacterized protein
MQMTDTFTIPVAADRLWKLLVDVERIAPCVPGFQLVEANHPDYRGVMKIKIGPISQAYDAVISFVERDDDARRAVLSVRGREQRGSGTVNATMTSSLTEKGQETVAEMVTDVQITGRVAHLGRGIVADVSSRLTEQFVKCLNERVLAVPQADATVAVDAGQAGTEPTARRPAQATEESEVNLGRAALVPLLKRVLAVAVLLALARRVRRTAR